MLRPIDVRAKPRALLGELTVGRQRKHLKAAAVSKYGTLPSVKLVETAGLLEYIYARTQIQVIRIAEYYLSLHIVAQLMLMHGLDTPERSHRHKYGSLDSAMVGSDESGTRISAGAVA